MKVMESKAEEDVSCLVKTKTKPLSCFRCHLLTSSRSLLSHVTFNRATVKSRVTLPFTFFSTSFALRDSFTWLSFDAVSIVIHHHLSFFFFLN